MLETTRMRVAEAIHEAWRETHPGAVYSFKELVDMAADEPARQPGGCRPLVEERLREADAAIKVMPESVRRLSGAHYGGKTLAELRSLCDAASALPWRVIADAYQFQQIGNDEGRKIAEVSAQPEHRNKKYGDDTNTKFILAACNALPDLIAALEE